MVISNTRKSILIIGEIVRKIHPKQLLQKNAGNISCSIILGLGLHVTVGLGAYSDPSLHMRFVMDKFSNVIEDKSRETFKGYT